MDQRTAQWFDARAGKITASMMHVVMLERDRVPFKSGPRKGQNKPPLKALSDYAHQLAAERLTRKPRNMARGAALDWGREVEGAAVAAFEAETGLIVTACGFIQHPVYDFIGASPDFLVGDDGGGEIKCPESSEVHLETLLTGLPAEHIEQIQGGLWTSGRKFWHFVSYHPDFDPSLRLYVQRVERDNEYIKKLEAACLEMESDVQAILSRVKQKEA